MSRLIRVFDNYYNFMNVIVPLSLDFDEVIYIYHHKIETSQFNNCSKVLYKYKKDIKVKYQYIKNDEKEVTNLLDKDTVIDISTARYLSAFLFEKALENNLKIVYYDEEESTIKDYRMHKIIINKVCSLDIEDMINLGGGKITQKQMHKHVNLNDLETTKAVVKVVENNLNKYTNFINYVTRVNTFITHRKINDLTFSLSDEIKKKIIFDEEYKRIKDFNLFTISDNKLKFMNKDIRDMFSVSGAFLENYLYIKLNESKMFEQVLMSAEIDFSTYYNNYPIKCEIDCLAIRNNHLLFISCKSNKVDTDALNEIKIHNTMFGNDLSDAIICTLDDLNKTAPAEYLKARELKIAVIDKTSFINKTIINDIVDVADGNYKYERV